MVIGYAFVRKIFIFPTLSTHFMNGVIGMFGFPLKAIARCMMSGLNTTKCLNFDYISGLNKQFCPIFVTFVLYEKLCQTLDD